MHVGEIERGRIMNNNASLLRLHCNYVATCIFIFSNVTRDPTMHAAIVDTTFVQSPIFTHLYSQETGSSLTMVTLISHKYRVFFFLKKLTSEYE